jgi:catechol 2,3-dioxygenase-like lactoylglutathione lyase family enzyme
MEKVSGIGGLFFRAQDPDGLARWYRDHLGLPLVPKDYGEETWWPEAGPSIVAPFPETTEYFRDPTKVWMVNFRVSHLDAMVAQLRAAGISVEVDQKQYPNGRFARLTDPEANPIELWEPAGRDTLPSAVV